MANDNATLGRFQLEGIMPAQRGIPQIEVTFDIDANGIVNVSAKDLGTGKEQKITISSSTKLSDDEIENKIKEAERFAEEDKKRKEEIEIRNSGDSLVYQTEKTLAELGDNVSAEEKTQVEEKLEELKKALEGEDSELIKTKTDELTEAFYAISQTMYEQAAQEAGDAEQGDDVVDADYEVVDEDEE